MTLIVFSAETVPSFGPILNLIGGTGVALTSAILPCTFYLFLNARYGEWNINSKKKLNHNYKINEKTHKEPPIPSLKE